MPIRPFDFVSLSELGAETTTEVLVLDKTRTLIYRGAVDDQYGFGYALDTPRFNYLASALDAMLAGDLPDVPVTPSSVAISSTAMRAQPRRN
jgi:hypothetical protein